MYSKLQFLEGMAKRNREEIHDRRTLLNSIYAMKGEGPPTAAGKHQSLTSIVEGSAAQDMSSTQGSLHQSASCPVLGAVQMEDEGGTQLCIRRPAERAGYASPPGTPISRKMRKLVLSVSKNADEIAGRRAFIDSIKNKNAGSEEPLASASASGAAFRPGPAASGRRVQIRRKQPVHTGLQSYCGAMSQPASAHKAYAPAMPCSESMTMKSRFQCLNERVMWNANKLQEHRAFLDDYLNL